MSDFTKGGLPLPEDVLFPLLNLAILFVLSIAAFKIYSAQLVSFSFLANWSQTVSNDDFRTLCLKFKPSFPSADVERIEYLEFGKSAALPYRHVTCGGPGSSAKLAQDVCRVALRIRTSDRSEIHFEAWLPKKFNNRFLATGNGGLNGCLDYASLVYGTEHGFATVAANNGHNGTSGLGFYQNSEILHDYADRSVHTSVMAGKDMIEQFYGIKHKRSYFLGCSQGGRQGIGSAQKFPDDFDGIVAGAPALDFNSLVSWRGSFLPITSSTHSPEFIKPEVWSGVIHDEVMRQCDDIDGVKDGIIEYPDQCQFHPEVLTCTEEKTNDCLTARQIDQVNRVYSPFAHLDGTLIFPGLQIGSEKRAIDRLLAGKPFSDSQDWFRYVVHSNPTWNPAKFTTDDAQLAQKLNPFNIRTYPSPQDLFPFTSRGGKILTYHGMQDQQITSHNTARWFEFLKSKSSETEIDQWLRYFRISGLYHCNGGPGAWMIGQTRGSVSFDPQSNVLAAVVKWVEEGQAPEEIEGTKLKDVVAAKGIQSTEVDFKRRHCRYPKRNHYRYYKSQVEDVLDTKKEPRTFSNVDEWTCV